MDYQDADTATASEEWHDCTIRAVAHRMADPDGGSYGWWVAQYRTEEFDRPERRGDVVPVEGQFFSAAGALAGAFEQARVELLRASFTSQRSAQQERRYPG